MRPPRKEIKTQSRIRGHLGEASKSEKCSPKAALPHRGRCSASLVRAPIPNPANSATAPPTSRSTNLSYSSSPAAHKAPSQGHGALSKARVICSTGGLAQIRREPRNLEASQTEATPRLYHESTVGGAGHTRSRCGTQPCQHLASREFCWTVRRKQRPHVSTAHVLLAGCHCPMSRLAATAPCPAWDRRLPESPGRRESREAGPRRSGPACEAKASELPLLGPSLGLSTIVASVQTCLLLLLAPQPQWGSSSSQMPSAHRLGSTAHTPASSTP